MKTLAMAIAIAALSATSTIAQFNPFFPSYNDRFLWSTTGVDVRCGSPYTHHRGTADSDGDGANGRRHGARDDLCNGRKRMHNTVRKLPSRIAPQLICG